MCVNVWKSVDAYNVMHVNIWAGVDACDMVHINVCTSVEAHSVMHIKAWMSMKACCEGGEGCRWGVWDVLVRCGGHGASCKMSTT